jgi:hypothetical protein
LARKRDFWRLIYKVTLTPIKTKLKLFAFILFALAAALRLEAQAPPQFFTIHHFNGSAGEGTSPIGNLVEDPNGNIFGVTQSGGTNNSTNGTFYALLAVGGISYNYTNLYNFTGGTNGENPVGDLTLQINDQAGNLAVDAGKLPTKPHPQDGGLESFIIAFAMQVSEEGTDQYGNKIKKNKIFIQKVQEQADLTQQEVAVKLGVTVRKVKAGT